MNKKTFILLNALADLISMAVQYAGYKLVMFIIGLFMLSPTLLAVIVLIANIAYIVFALSPLSRLEELEDNFDGILIFNS